MLSAHRVAYELTRGPIPAGMEIDHLCRVRSCVNPDHLEAVTRGENLRRGRGKTGAQTHCKRGHELTPENTYRYVNRRGYVCRHCRQCRRAAS